MDKEFVQSPATAVKFHQLNVTPDQDSINSFKLYCPYENCSSLILVPGVGKLVRRSQIPQGPVPPTPEKSDILDSDTSDADQNDNLFWVLSDPFEFENLGFSKSSDSGIKYLACADCDRGPLGYHDSSSSEPEYLLSATKVLYRPV
ncbi:Mss4-like protein [Lipomyces oligophaga]|uniref:Mss4-like protein n=1 Tax=Lipomyces oligophaga TaxID=45792 RepID=UPI0034CD98EE